MIDRLLLEAQRVERAIGRVRWGAAAITLLLGPLFPTLSVAGVYALGAGIILYNVATLAASRRATTRATHAAVARAAFAGDIGALAAAMLLFAADAQWTTYILGPLVITTGAFRFGTGGTVAASLGLGGAYAAIVLFRDRAFGYALEPERVLFTLSVYALTAILVDRVMRDSRQLRTEREDLITRLERRIAENEDLSNRNLDLTRLSDNLGNVLTSAHVPIIIVGPDGRIRRMTQAMERTLGLSASDIGRPIGELRLGVEFPDLDAMVREAIETAAPVDREVQAGDGRSYSVRVRPYRADGDRIEGAIVSFIDIDDLKRTEREVREARDVARATFETVREPLVTLDASLHVVQANRSFYETFGVTPAATEGTFIYDLGNRQWDIPELRRLLEEILPRDAVVSDFEVEHAFEGLGQRTMCLNASLVLRATTEDPLILLAIEDVTTAKELERTRAALVEREQALRATAEQATQAKDRFLAVLSHELRSPLQSMLGWVRLLRSRRLSTAHTTRALDVIERNTVLQARLIEDLLDVSRITAGVLQLDLAPMLVAPAVQTVIENLRPAADAKRIRLVVSIEDDAGRIQGDAARVQQIVGNLVSNAMKFTPSGGRIEVRIARRGSEVEIRVSDTGAGISSDQLPQVFAPFGTEPRKRSHGGLGLGLGIARHLAELHGGTLDAASAGLGHGATFTVTLPLTVERPAADEAPDRAAASGPTEGLAGRHVLVVEDDADTREVITLMLEDSGGVVTAAATVAAALSELERVRPDVLLSDLSLPDGDGYDLIRSVRALDPAHGGSIPAIALTAYASTEDRERVMAAGFQRCLSKPIDLEELVAAIATLADRT